MRNTRKAKQKKRMIKTTVKDPEDVSSSSDSDSETDKVAESVLSRIAAEAMEDSDSDFVVNDIEQPSKHKKKTVRKSQPMDRPTSLCFVIDRSKSRDTAGKESQGSMHLDKKEDLDGRSADSDDTDSDGSDPSEKDFIRLENDVADIDDTGKRYLLVCVLK